MKKILVLASAFAAFGLVACGDDSGSSSSDMSCSIDFGDFGGVICMQSSDMKEADCTGMTGTVVNDCPANPTATCEESTDGKSATVYYYEAGATCD